jgi:hypothetical protein
MQSGASSRRRVVEPSCRLPREGAALICAPARGTSRATAITRTDRVRAPRPRPVVDERLGAAVGGDDPEALPSSGHAGELAATLDAPELDHVLIAVADLAAAAREIEARHGLASIERGRHPGWGMANRIVPLGESYLALVTVVDEADAAQSSFGSWVARLRCKPARLLGWAVRTYELEDVAVRLDSTIGAGSRATRSRQRLPSVDVAGAGARWTWPSPRPRTSRAFPW